MTSFEQHLDFLQTWESYQRGDKKDDVEFIPPPRVDLPKVIVNLMNCDREFATHVSTVINLNVDSHRTFEAMQAILHITINQLVDMYVENQAIYYDLLLRLPVMRDYEINPLLEDYQVGLHTPDFANCVRILGGKIFAVLFNLSQNVRGYSFFFESYWENSLVVGVLPND